MTKVTIFLLYLQTYLSVSIRYVFRVEDNYSLCFHARTGECQNNSRDKYQHIRMQSTEATCIP